MGIIPPVEGPEGQKGGRRLNSLHLTELRNGSSALGLELRSSDSDGNLTQGSPALRPLNYTIGFSESPACRGQIVELLKLPLLHEPILICIPYICKALFLL